MSGDDRMGENVGKEVCEVMLSGQSDGVWQYKAIGLSVVNGWRS